VDSIVADGHDRVYRTYFKNNLNAHGSVAKRFKMYCSSRFYRDSAFLPFRAPDGGISQSSTCSLNPNLTFEMGSTIFFACCKTGFNQNILQALLKIQITTNYGIAIFLKMNIRALLDNLFFLIDIQTILRIVLI